MLPIAQVASATYLPVVLLLIGYAVLSILAGRARTHDDRAQAERLSNWTFLLTLVFAAYVLVLLLVAVFSYPSRSWDMVLIIVVIAAFFALLLFAFFVVAELVPRAFRRGGDR